MHEQIISLPYNFEPWPHQLEVFDAFYVDGIRRFCCEWHRRSGKDKTFLNLMIDQMTMRKGNYCHVFPQRNQARRIVWQGIDSDGNRYIDHFPPELIYRKSEVEMTISLCEPDDETTEGSIYWVMGSDKDVNLLVGANPVGVIWSEFALINPRMRQLALPIIRRNRGWEAIIYTPRGKNHAVRLYDLTTDNPEWFTSRLTINDTVDEQGAPLVTDDDVQADLAAGMEQSMIDQEYYLSREAAMPGAYYAEEFRTLHAQNRITDVPYNPAFPVYTAWDLGHNDANAIWFFQHVGDRVHFIDYLEDSSVALVYDDEDQRDQEGRPHGWVWRVKHMPYCYDHSQVTPPLTRSPYEVHYGPHDIEVHEYSTGKTRYSVALHAGLRFSVLPRGPIEDGISASRRLLARAVFDQTRCEQGIEALKSYRRELDEKNMVFRNAPLHDWASNGADAFRSAAVGIMPRKAPLKTTPQPGSFEYEAKRAERHWAGRRR